MDEFEVRTYEILAVNDDKYQEKRLNSQPDLPPPPLGIRFESVKGSDKSIS